MATLVDGCGGGSGTGSGGLMFPPETKNILPWISLLLETFLSHSVIQTAAWWGVIHSQSEHKAVVFFYETIVILYPTSWAHTDHLVWWMNTTKQITYSTNILPLIGNHWCIMKVVCLKIIDRRKKQTCWCDLVPGSIQDCYGRHLSCLSCLAVYDSFGTCKGDQSFNTRYDFFTVHLQGTICMCSRWDMGIHQEIQFCGWNTWSMGHGSKGSFCLWFKHIVDGTRAKQETQFLWFKGMVGWTKQVLPVCGVFLLTKKTMRKVAW